MASAASPSLSLFRASRRHGHPPPGRSRRRVLASDTSSRDSPPSRRTKGTPGVDTRIHWSSPDEGWVGGRSRPDTATEKNQNLGGRFADLIGDSTTSHYQLSTPPPLPPAVYEWVSPSATFASSDTGVKKKKKRRRRRRFLGVPADADMEEIKAAYRRLSKEYHPDTTVLPLKTASQKFMQLRQAYNVLSDGESRRFYDWTLAQEAESRRAERMRMRLDDPYMQDVSNWESIPDTVDRLGGKNMKLSDQAMTALTIDVVIILFSICCIIFVVFFKEPY